jgi:hypothetical protein
MDKKTPKTLNTRNVKHKNKPILWRNFSTNLSYTTKIIKPKYMMLAGNISILNKLSKPTTTDLIIEMIEVVVE